MRRREFLQIVVLAGLSARVAAKRIDWSQRFSIQGIGLGMNKQQVLKAAGKPLKEQEMRGMSSWWYRDPAVTTKPTRDLQYTVWDGEELDGVSGYALAQSGQVILRQGDSPAQVQAQLGEPIRNDDNQDTRYGSTSECTCSLKACGGSASSRGSLSVYVWEAPSAPANSPGQARRLV